MRDIAMAIGIVFAPSAASTQTSVPPPAGVKQVEHTPDMDARVCIWENYTTPSLRRRIVSAVDSVIRGRVFLAGTLEPVPKGQVAVELGSSGNQFSFVDDSGFFAIPHVKDGVYPVAVRGIGYIRVIDTVVIGIRGLRILPYYVQTQMPEMMGCPPPRKFPPAKRLDTLALNR